MTASRSAVRSSIRATASKFDPVSTSTVRSPSTRKALLVNACTPRARFVIMRRGRSGDGLWVSFTSPPIASFVFIANMDYKMGAGTCPRCGKVYERLGQHWSMSNSCSHPTIPDSWIELLVGILMGDGTIHDPPSAKNLRIEVTNINKTFLEWIDEKLSWLSNGVALRRTAEEIREENRDSQYERFASLDYEIRDQY